MDGLITMGGMRKRTFRRLGGTVKTVVPDNLKEGCLLYTSDAADE